jgi:hypothetical protein
MDGNAGFGAGRGNGGLDPWGGRVGGGVQTIRQYLAAGLLRLGGLSRARLNTGCGRWGPRPCR